MKLLTALLCATCLSAQPGILNPGFDSPGPEGLPAGWTVPAAASHYDIRRVGTGCKLGACVEMKPGPESSDRPGILEQTFSTTQILGKVARLGFSRRVEPGGKAALLVKVTNAAGEVVYTDNTLNYSSPEPYVWSGLELLVPVTLDAETITIQVLASGANVVVDSLYVSVPISAPSRFYEGEAPSRLNRTAQNNLVAFARMYGAVRHFYPTSQVTEADWNMLAVEGVRTLDYAIEPESLARRLNVVFERVAPTVKAYVGEAPALANSIRPKGDQKWVSYRYRGLERILEAGTRRDFKSFTLELWRGLRARIPLTAAIAPTHSTRSKMIGLEMPPVDSYTGGDRAVRLANVIISWNYLKYFHPQRRTREFEWDNALVRALQQAAVDKNGDRFADTLRKMLMQLDDAQANVSYEPRVARGVLPVPAEWIDGKLIQLGGDEIISIDNKPVAILFEECCKRYAEKAAAQCVIAGQLGQPATLGIRPAGAQTLRRTQMTYAEEKPNARLKLEEVSPAVWYVDMARMTEQDWAEALPKLETARGIVFDLRGGIQLGPEWLGHLSATSLRTQEFQIPLVDGPEQMRYEPLPALVLPALKPLFSTRKLFLVDGKTVGASEKMLHEIINHKLGETVGEPTAGAPGDPVSILLPGNYRIHWTGTMPMRPAGKIEPTTLVKKSMEGVSAGLDEVLSRALALIPKVL